MNSNKGRQGLLGPRSRVGLALALLLAVIGLTFTPAGVAARETWTGLPWHLLDIYYDHRPVAPFQSITTEVNVIGPVANKQYLYLCVLFGKIGNTAFYYGLQTDLASDRGLLFSRWGLGNPETDVRVPENGWKLGLTNAQSGEGDFVSVRTLWPWSAGRYSFALTRRPVNDGPGFWADLQVTDRSTGQVIDGGGLRFYENAEAKVTSLVSFVELYNRPPGIRFPDEYRPPPLTIRLGSPVLAPNQRLTWASARTPGRIPRFALPTWVGDDTTIALDPSLSALERQEQPPGPWERVLYRYP